MLSIELFFSSAIKRKTAQRGGYASLCMLEKVELYTHIFRVLADIHYSLDEVESFVSENVGVYELVRPNHAVC